MDLPQEWITRDGLIGDDEEADALNDETFGDGGDWDDVDPMNAGDISDLSSMTLGRQDILKEAAAMKNAHSEDFPSLPTGTPMLGGVLLTPGALMTPQMLLSKPVQQKQEQPPQQQQQRQPQDWQAPTGYQHHQQVQQPGGVPGGAPGGFQQQFHGQHIAADLPHRDLTQGMLPGGGAPPPPGMSVAPRGAMSLEEIEQQMMRKSQAAPVQTMEHPHQQPMQQHTQPMQQHLPPPPPQQQPLPPHVLAQMQQHMAHIQAQGGNIQQMQAMLGHQYQMLMRQQQMAQAQAQAHNHHQQQSLSEIMREQASERGMGMRDNNNNQFNNQFPSYGQPANPRGDVSRMNWTRMTGEEVNQIIRLQNSMLRDAAATNVYHSMLLAKQGTRANFAGPKIEGRSIKLSEALEGALGKPAPHDLRRPRQLLKVEREKRATEREGKENGVPVGAGAGGPGEGKSEMEGDNLNVPSVISKLPRAVRLSVENGMIRLLNVQDIDKITIPDPTTSQRRATQVVELYELFHVNDLKGARPATIDADMSSLSECKLEADKFFEQLVLVPKGCKLVLRALNLLHEKQQSTILAHILRCLLPIGYQSETHKESTGIEMLVQLLVKLVYSLNFLQLLDVLSNFMKAYSDGGLHLLICTKLGALALAALLRRGHDEYMADDIARSAEDKETLLRWAGTCQALISRCHKGLEPLFNAATQGGITALPKHMIIDPEVMVDFLYELGANANQEQRSAICRELAAIAGKNKDPQMKEQVAQLLQSLQWAE